MTPISLFLRGWWHAARHQPYLHLPAPYPEGYATGVAWRQFHGRFRRPNTTFALNAWTRYKETSNVASDMTRINDIEGHAAVLQTYDNAIAAAEAQE